VISYSLKVTQGSAVKDLRFRVQDFEFRVEGLVMSLKNKFTVIDDNPRKLNRGTIRDGLTQALGRGSCVREPLILIYFSAPLPRPSCMCVVCMWACVLYVGVCVVS
jgi:hypothetical protein